MYQHTALQQKANEQPTCSRRFTKAKMRFSLTSAFRDLNSRLKNMVALLLDATSGDSSMPYRALHSKCEAAQPVLPACEDAGNHSCA